MTTPSNSADMPPPGVLVVETDQSTVEAVSGCLNGAGLLVSVESSGETALDRLASEQFDCLVVDPAVEGIETDQFVTSLRSTPARCPVVWFSRGEAEPIDDDALDLPTTIVEQGSVSEDCSFLVEKIRGIIETDSPRGGDRSTFRALVESASDGLYTLDAAGRVTYLNESFAEMLGFERGELSGVHAASVMADGELERGQRIVQELMADDDRESAVMDMDMRTKDGDHLAVSVHFSVLTADDGTYKGLMGVVRDVTDRKRRERALARERERLEEFASVVSHDLRSPLSVAAGRVELAQEDCESEDLDAAMEALDRMGGLIEDLLDLARQGKTVDDPDRVDLAQLVETARATVPETVTVRIDLADAWIRADRTRLLEVFENLFENTVDHAGPDSTIDVGILDAGRGVYVEDDGPGIPEQHRDSVFDHGYTTGSGGTGFGLSIVKRIVEAHGWEITATSAASGGARFEITGVDVASAADRGS